MEEALNSSERDVVRVSDIIAASEKSRVTDASDLVQTPQMEKVEEEVPLRSKTETSDDPALVIA